MEEETPHNLFMQVDGKKLGKKGGNEEEKIFKNPEINQSNQRLTVFKTP
jgi:hypothetical protein